MMKMKQDLKKLAALCLSFIMVLGISVPSVANAEEGTKVIDVVEVNGVQEAAVGVAVTDETFAIPEGANYSFNFYGNGWLVEYQPASYSWLDNGTLLETGEKYQVCINIVPNDGYVFTEDTVMKINGEVVDAYVNLESQYVAWSKYYSFREQVDKVEINNVPTAELGGKATTQGITLPEDAKYEITHTAWYQIPKEGAHVQLEEGSVFEEGKSYRLQMNVEPKTGCEFSEDYEVTVNGQEPDEYWGGSSISVFNYFSFREKIDKIEVDNVPTAEIGKEASVEGVTIPENANYEITYVGWYDEATYDELQPGTKFEKGKKYSINVCVEPKEGYEFAEDAEIHINGKAECDESYIDPDFADLYVIYSFLEQIDKIEILEALPDAKVGETADADQLKVPEGAKYTASYAWMTGNIGETDNTIKPFMGSFEQGTAYVLALSVEAEEGYEFAEDAVATIAGKPVETLFVTNGGDTYLIMETHDLGNNTIDRIEIIATEPKAGDKISVDNVKVPENAKYEIVEVAWFDAKTKREATGTFQEGKQYKLMVVVAPKEGMYFANDVSITLNGKEFAGAKFENGMIVAPFLVACGLGFDLTLVDNNPNNNYSDNIQNNNQSTTITPSPATGDNANMILWIAFVAIAIVGIVVVISKKNVK